MSSKETTIKNAKGALAAVPAPPLRFPEFRDAGDWEARPLGDLASVITERVGDRNHTPFSITTGVGLVSQVEKFGRVIAGSQYRNYLCLQQGDFAYNKSATNGSPQGFIARYLGSEPAAVPNSIFTCFRVDIHLIDGDYLNQLFMNNLHGRWLRRFMTVGARAHGSLNIDDEDILAIPVPMPRHHLKMLEQQEIAECLSSLDELITAERQKLDALKAHKKGLMQQLFPAEGETTPRLRFPEFRCADEWEAKCISDLGRIVTGSTPSTATPEFYGGGRSFVSPADISEERFISRTNTTLTEHGFRQTRSIPPNSILFVCIGSTIGKLAQNLVECASNQQINAVIPNSEHCAAFLYYTLTHVAPQIAALAGRHAVPIINKTAFGNVEVILPKRAEQERIAECLSSLDERITAQTRQVEALRAQKTGLMQQLFPSLDEVQA
jgi:type I restriction enzyme S subunit